MLIFNIFDSLQQRFFPALPPFKGHFNLILIRFVICGSIAVALAVVSRRYFEEPFLRLKDRIPFSSLAGSSREAAAA